MLIRFAPEHFEVALLVQSLLMIVSQFGLLHLALKYAPGSESSSVPAHDPEAAAAEEEPLSHHQASDDPPLDSAADWMSKPIIPLAEFGQFLEFFAGLVVLLAVSYFIFGGFSFYVSLLGILALGIESLVRRVPSALVSLGKAHLISFCMIASSPSASHKLEETLSRRLSRCVCIGSGTCIAAGADAVHSNGARWLGFR